MILPGAKFRSLRFSIDNFILNLPRDPKALLNMDLTNDHDLAAVLLLGLFNDDGAFDENNRKKIEKGLRALHKSAHDTLMFFLSAEMSKCWDNLIKS